MRIPGSGAKARRISLLIIRCGKARTNGDFNGGNRRRRLWPSLLRGSIAMSGGGDTSATEPNCFSGLFRSPGPPSPVKTITAPQTCWPDELLYIRQCRWARGDHPSWSSVGSASHAAVVSQPTIDFDHFQKFIFERLPRESASCSLIEPNGTLPSRECRLPLPRTHIALDACAKRTPGTCNCMNVISRL